MGGRRARSVAEIAGTGLQGEKAQFTRALKRKDPEAVAIGSAKLVAKSPKATEILFYASKLADFVRGQVERGESLSYSERERLARKEWSRIKRKEKIPDDPITTRAIVSAAAKAISRKRR